VPQLTSLRDSNLARGIGESASPALPSRNSIFHATSKRVRDLPHHAGQIALKPDSDDHAMGASL
jgi:CO/xanthine dehydrogenase Mo-binding subunit